MVQNLAQAAARYEKAAALGYAPALLALANMYADGEGVVQDYARAHTLFDAALLCFTEEEGAEREGAVVKRDLMATKITSKGWWVGAAALAKRVFLSSR